MNKSFLKFVTDFGPLAIFFFYYYNNDKNLSIAIPPLIVATLIALVVFWFFEKKIANGPKSVTNFKKDLFTKKILTYLPHHKTLIFLALIFIFKYPY